MGDLRGREFQARTNRRNSRMSRLSDSGLLDIFLAARKAGLARGLSVIQANETAHAAVETRLNARPVFREPGSLDAPCPMESSPTVNIVRDDHKISVALTGPLDQTSIDNFELLAFREIDSQNLHVILDLRKVTYISSAGAGSIIKFFSQIADREGKLTVIKPSKSVHAVLDISGLTTFLTFVEKPEDVMS